VVEKIKGYDKTGKLVFERNAREYDKSITKTVFGITVADIFKAVPILVLAGVIYGQQEDFNHTVFEWHKEDVSTIEGIKNTLENLNSWLSSSTGRPFKDGMPEQAEIGANAPNFK